MRHWICVLLFLLSAVLLPGSSWAQEIGVPVGAEGASESGFQLGVNYPNPVSPETRIPFDLFGDLFSEGRTVVVSMRIYDILRQYVVSPTAQGHPAGEGVALIDLEYTSPGRYEAFWDGRDRNGSYVASSVYILELTVNGRSQIRRILVSR